MRMALEARLLFDGAVIAAADQVMDDKAAAQDQAPENNTGSGSASGFGLEAADISAAFNVGMDQKEPAPQPRAAIINASSGQAEPFERS